MLGTHSPLDDLTAIFTPAGVILPSARALVQARATGDQALPAGVINVDSTTGLAGGGIVYTPSGEALAYTGKTGTTLTGVTGGSGVLQDGAVLTTRPPGWLLCDGGLARLDHYPRLDALIGALAAVGAGRHAYNGGASPAANRLRLPNLRRAFPLGQAAAGTGSEAGSGAAGAKLGDGLGHVHGAGSLAMGSHAHGPGSIILPGHGHGHSFNVGAHAHGLSGTNNTIFGGGDTAAQRYTAATGTFGPGGTVFGGVAAAGDGPVDGASAAATPGTLAGSTGPGDPPYLMLDFLVKT